MTTHEPDPERDSQPDLEPDSEGGYSLLGLLTEPKTWKEWDLAKLESHVAKRFRSRTGAKVTQGMLEDLACVEITLDGWAMWLLIESGDAVLDESKEMASEASGRPDRDKIAGAQVRIELCSQADPEMDYFDDYVLVMEALEKIPGVVLFDVSDGEFLSE